MANQDVQELVVFLSLNRYTIDGWQVNICNKSSWETYNSALPSNKFLFEVQADIGPHKEWLCQASVAFAEKLKQQAVSEYSDEMRAIKEFEAKFLMLNAPVVQPPDVRSYNEPKDYNEEEIEDATFTEVRDCPSFDMGHGGEDCSRD